MMDTAFERQEIPAGFTLRIVEAVKRIKIHPTPRMAGLPWGLSLAAGIIITVMSLNPQMSIPSDMAVPTGSPLPVDTKVLKTGEIPVDILKTSEISIIDSKQGDGDGGKPQPQMTQNALMLAPRAEGGTWAAKADMPTARARLSTSVVDGKIYAIGGLSDSWMLAETVEEYDPATDKWTEKADMLTARFGLSTSVVNGRIYAIGGAAMVGGGWVGAPTEEYDPATGTWTEKADMPTARMNHCTGVVNGKIYAIGGHDDKPNTLSIVEEYDPASDKWTRKADMPTARNTLAASVVNGKIYVIGGISGGSAVEEYDPATDKWTKKANMPTSRYGVSTSVVSGKIYAIGGGGGPPYYSTVEVYDPATDTWAKKANMLTARAFLSTSLVNGKIYAIGGSQNWPDPLSVVEEYTPEGWPFERFSISPQGKLTTMWGEVKSD